MLKKYRGFLFFTAGIATNFIANVGFGIFKNENGYNGSCKTVSELIVFDLALLIGVFLIERASYKKKQY